MLMLTAIGSGNRHVDFSKQNYGYLATVWYPANLGPVLLSNKYILFLPRLGLSPDLPSYEVSSFIRQFIANNQCMLFPLPCLIY